MISYILEGKVTASKLMESKIYNREKRRNLNFNIIEKQTEEVEMEMIF